MVFEEHESPDPQVALAGASGSRGGAPVTGHAFSDRRGGGDLAMVAARTRARSRSVFSAPAAITLGVGVCGAAGFLVFSAGRRRRDPRVARVQSRRARRGHR
jgi:hypothetical protein